ncbi:MAG: hypothetical protein CME70_09105 [Halobacteriovorax sp.]|nr:hypothetical protein [Halobacteriovorax sp.]
MRLFRSLIILIFLSGCTWTSEKGWHPTPDPVGENKERSALSCVGENEFGKFTKGGGCNEFGCWLEGGSCNQFGCSVNGKCNSKSCEKKIESIECHE